MGPDLSEPSKPPSFSASLELDVAVQIDRFSR